MRLAITGGSGSFGTALVRRLLAEHRAERIAVISRHEPRQAAMAREFADDPELRLFLADVRDRARLQDVFDRTDVVIHAAALKRIDDIAYHPDEVVKTNVVGTINVIDAAIANHVRTVLVISSDKAAAAVTAYGVSKALAEFCAIMKNARGHAQGTRISVVRWGNVACSTQSVIPFWRQCIMEGRPLPLTDKRMSRFILTLDQAVTFTLRWLHRLKGGEILIPRLPSIMLTDLAEAIAPGYPIDIVGFRAGGEKLAECLVTEEEARHTLAHPDGAYVITPTHQPWANTRWDGDPLPDGFRYTSDGNDWWLSVDEIRALIGA